MRYCPILILIDYKFNPLYTDDRHLSPLMTGGVPRFVVNRFIVDTVFVTRSIRFDSMI